MAGTWPGRRARKIGERPYATFEAPGWRTEVLKINAGPNATGPYRSAFVRVVSDMTGPSGDIGDQYTANIPGPLVDFDSEVFPTAADAMRAVFGDTRAALGGALR